MCEVGQLAISPPALFADSSMGGNANAKQGPSPYFLDEEETRCAYWKAAENDPTPGVGKAKPRESDEADSAMSIVLLRRCCGTKGSTAL